MEKGEIKREERRREWRDRERAKDERWYKEGVREGKERGERDERKTGMDGEGR